MTSAIAARGLAKEYRTSYGVVRALDDVSVDFLAGEVTAVVGPSGSGKTTLLSLLGGLEAASGGDVEVEGAVRGSAFRDLATYRRRHVGFVFQAGNLLPHLTAIENVMAPMELAGVPWREARGRAARLLNDVGIGPERHGHRPSRLSGGQQQRVAFARALANDPPIILADEPTGNLDRENGRQVFALLEAKARERGICVVLVTHDLELASLAGRVLTLDDGRLASDVRRRPSPADHSREG